MSKARNLNKTTEQEDETIRCIAIAVRSEITSRWHQPDWNYLYYDQFEKAVARGIRMAIDELTKGGRT